MKIQFYSKRIAALIMYLSLFSCDPFYSAKILNNSNEDVLIEIQFDNIALATHWDNSSYMPFLEGKMREGGTLISFDSINLISKIKLKPKEFFVVEGGMNTHPDFYLIKSIHIFDKDTIILNSKEKMFELFRKRDEGTFDFEIK